jgi:hypothetical protein
VFLPIVWWKFRKNAGSAQCVCADIAYVKELYAIPAKIVGKLLAYNISEIYGENNCKKNY